MQLLMLTVRSANTNNTVLLPRRPSVNVTSQFGRDRTRSQAISLEVLLLGSANCIHFTSPLLCIQQAPAGAAFQHRGALRLKAAHSLTRSSHPRLLGPKGPCADSGASEPVPRAACLRRSLSPLRGSTPQGKVRSPPYPLAAPPNSGCFSSFSPPPFLYCPVLKACENCGEYVLNRLKTMLLFKC